MKKITLITLLVLGFYAPAQTITHSNELTLGTTNVACNGGTPSTSRDNRYYRFFDLSTFAITSNYLVTNVNFGIQTLTIPTLPDGFPVIVKIYSSIETDFPLNFPASYTEIASATRIITLTDVGTLVSVPIPNTALIPAGSSLLVEVGYDAPVANSGNRIFLSANDLGQTAPTYIASTTCSILVPTDMASINFPNAHFILTVDGTTLSTNENALDQKIALYPNPSNGIYNIELSDAISIEKITLNDISGKQFSVALDSNNTLDITSLQSGVYFLTIQTNEGTASKKILKQ
jgi:hypothetical protein